MPTPSRTWWYKIAEQVHGPVSSLEHLVRCGVVKPGSMLRYGDSEWAIARTFTSAEAIFRSLGLVDAPPEVPPVPTRPSRAPLVEWAPMIERPIDGRGVPLVNVQRGAPQLVRAVGEVDACWVHVDGHGSTPCLGDKCQRCPGRRDRYGYLDALLIQSNLRTGQPEVYRAVQSMPPGVMRRITDGELLQGCLLSLHWKGQGSPTELKLLQNSCPYPLPAPIDIHTFLRRIWRLAAWPDQEPAVEVPADPNILRFRKQA